jgi:CheY-like chemotaxis protein
MMKHNTFEIPWVIELHNPQVTQPLKVCVQDRVTLGWGMTDNNLKPDISVQLVNGQDPSISYQHLMFYCEDSTLMVMDLNSENGSAINSQPLEPSVGYRLTHGDQLRLGDLEFNVDVVLFPNSLDENEADTQPSLQDMSSPSSKQWVLVVEDDPDIARIIAQMIEQAGYMAKTVRDVVSAIRIFSQKQPNAVILDFKLPDLDGIEFCRYVRRDVLHSTLPIIAIQANNSSNEAAQALQAGVDLVMERPLNASHLRDMTMALINQHENSTHAIRTRRLVQPTPFNVFPQDARPQGALIYVAGQDNDPIFINAASHKSISFGRKPGSESLGSESHVDLTRYDAINCGVSRVHMFLHYLDDQFFIEDADSRNGTFLNGMPLQSYQLTPVGNGDEIRLGHLRAYVYFIEDTAAVA